MTIEEIKKALQQKHKEYEAESKKLENKAARLMRAGKEDEAGDLFMEADAVHMFAIQVHQALNALKYM